jgi:hypothetical protein
MAAPASRIVFNIGFLRGPFVFTGTADQLP